MPRGDNPFSDDLKEQVKERLKSGLSGEVDDDEDRPALPEPKTPSGSSFTSVKLEHVAHFLRELSVLLKAGFPLLKALNLLGKGRSNARMSKAIRRIATEVEEGGAFWKAVQRHPDIFRPLAVAIIRAGESSGTLEEALDYLADSTEYEVEVNAKIRNALTYPLFFAVLVVIAMGVLLFGVVPQFEELYSTVGSQITAGADKPWLFTALVELSRGFKLYFTAILLISIVVVGGVWYLFSSKKFLVIEKFKLRIPLFGKLMVLGDLTRLSKTLAVLLESGIPLLQSLDLCKGVMNNLEMKQAVQDMRDSAESGGALTEPLTAYKVIPPLTTDMLVVGEEAGSLQSSLDHLGRTMQTDIDRLITRITALIQPILLVIMGVVVVVFFLALFVPYFDMLSQFRPYQGAVQSNTRTRTSSYKGNKARKRRARRKVRRKKAPVIKKKAPAVKKKIKGNQAPTRRKR